MDYDLMDNCTDEAVQITELSSNDAFDALMSDDFYCTSELPQYFVFSNVLKYAAESIGDKTLEMCINGDCMPEQMQGVNLDIITNKDGRYAVRPLTIANPFLYYMLVRDICNDKAWNAIKGCFARYRSKHISACAIPMVKVNDIPEPFKGATTIISWWNKVEQRSFELSLKYSYMFMTDITNCFGQINSESIAWALALKDTPHQTSDNAALAANIRRYLKAMQQGRNIGIPQGSALFSLIAEIVLGYTDMLLAQEIAKAQADGLLPGELEYEILRYVDDYRIFCNDRDALEKISYILQHILERFNFRMNSSKTRTSCELITDSIKPDKTYYIFNTPIDCKQSYDSTDYCEDNMRRYDFDGFQKHLLFIYEFSRRYPDSGQLIRLLDEFGKRVERQLTTSVETMSQRKPLRVLGLPGIKLEPKKRDKRGHLWENITAMIAIAVEIAAKNLRTAKTALKVVSLMLSDIQDQNQKNEIIGLIYKKLIRIPNSAFLQVWMQNITHLTDDWSRGQVYDMPLCMVVAQQPVTLWNNSWLRPEISDSFHQDSIIDRETLANTGQVIANTPQLDYDETTTLEASDDRPIDDTSDSDPSEISDLSQDEADDLSEFFDYILNNPLPDISELRN